MKKSRENMSNDQRNAAPGRILYNGALTLDPELREARLAGRLLPLRPKELRILEALLRLKGRIVTFASLAETAWDDADYVPREVMKVHIHGLKKRIGRYGKRIRAVWGIGYRWAGRGGR